MRQHTLTKYLSAYKYPLVLFLFLRLWTLAWATLSTLSWPVPIAENARFYYGAQPDSNLVSAPWQRWDSLWYIKIAERGYASDDLSTAFFPFLPLVVRTIQAFIPLNSIVIGMGVSTLATLVAFVLFYRLAHAVIGETGARRSLLYFATYPLGFILFAVYPESLFVALAIGAWLCALSERWACAGILGGLAALTRAQGILLIFPLAFLFIRQNRLRQVGIWRAAWLSMIIAGTGIYVLYLYQLSGSLIAWLSTENNWLHAALPWDSVSAAVLTPFQNSDPGIIFFALLDILTVVLFFALMIIQMRRGEWGYALIIAVILFPPLFTVPRSIPSLPLASLPRHLVLAFPAFIELGRFNLRAPLVFALALLSLLIQTLLLIAFAHWVFIA